MNEASLAIHYRDRIECVCGTHYDSRSRGGFSTVVAVHRMPAHRPLECVDCKREQTSGDKEQR